MKLYMAVAAIDREPGSLIGIFTSKEAANKAAARRGDRWVHPEVTEIEADLEYELGEIRL
jgi:hypothetical protein